MHRYIKTLVGLVQEYAQSHDGIIWGAEIGVWRGNCAWNLIRRVPSLHLYLVDSYEEESLEDNFLTPGMSVTSAQEAFKGLFPYRNRCRWLLMPSVEAAKLIPDGSLDYAFIDADHRYPAIKKDIPAWVRKIRPGGFLAGDDINWEGVKKAVGEEFGKEYNRKSRVWWVEL